MLDHSAADSVFVFTFVAPTLVHDKDPALDFDKASFALVKSYGHSTGEPPFSEMTWQPKEAFPAVADAYEAMPN